MGRYAPGAAASVVTGNLEPHRVLFVEEAARVGLAPEILMALAAHESNGQADAAGPVNENGTRDYGLMQVNGSNYEGDPADLYDPAVNVPLGADIFAAAVARTGGDVPWAVSAYNRGFRATYQGVPLTRGRLPGGTFSNQAYVDDVLAWFRALRVQAGKSGEPADVQEAGIATNPFTLLLLGGLAVGLLWARYRRA